MDAGLPFVWATNEMLKALTALAADPAELEHQRGRPLEYYEIGEPDESRGGKIPVTIRVNTYRVWVDPQKHLEQHPGDGLRIVDLTAPKDPDSRYMESTVHQLGGTIELGAQPEREHDKVYANRMLLTDPPQVPWICRKCLGEGVDPLEISIRHHLDLTVLPHPGEYDMLKAAKAQSHQQESASQE